MVREAEVSAQGDDRVWRMHPLSLWHLLNQPRPIETNSLRLACAVLAVAYLAILVVRVRADDPLVCHLVRAALAAYAFTGVWLIPRLRWRGVRAYTVGAVLAFSFGVAYIHALLGNPIGLVPITGLAIFVPTLVLQTGFDLAAMAIVQILGHAALIACLWPPQAPLATLGIILTGSILVGTVIGTMVLAYRVLLHESLRSLERALRAKSTFLNTMSHELRSPLHVIMGYVDMLRDDVPHEPVISRVERIRTSALELLHLVESTLHVARLESGRLRLDVHEFCPMDLVSELRENVRALPEAKGGVPVQWSVAPDVPGVVALDRLKLKEIVQNLVSNALKFTRTGGVSVVVSADAAHLRIAVRDTGPGIPVEAQARVFDMFERVEDGRGSCVPGVGLGLYIVKSLVHLMRGRIEVTSDVGAGTCFVVQLPLRLTTA